MGVKGAFDPTPCSTIGKAAKVLARSLGWKILEYQEKAGLK
jgi:hypothetical protein